MPSNETIKQIRVLDAETEQYSDYPLSAAAEGIEVEYDDTTTDLQSAITGLDQGLKNKGQATWNGEGKDAILNQNAVYGEHVKFGQGTGTATLSGTICTAVIPNYVRKNNGIVMLTFQNDVPQNTTLNIQETGAKPIYFANAPILDNIIHEKDTATFVYDENANYGNGAYRLLAVDTGTGNTLFDPDVRDFYYEGNTGYMTLQTPVFEGTSQEWENLSEEDKGHYDQGLIHLVDENEFVISDVSDTVELNNMDAVTSNATAKKINEVGAEIAEDVEISNTAEKTHNVGEYIHYQNEDNVSKFARVNSEIQIGDTINEKVTDTSVGEVLNSLNTQIVDLIYPVGSIYMSVNSVNPSTLFTGTTWVEWGAGRVPVGVDSNDAAFDTVEETGGEKVHQLSVAEMPKHNHTFTGESTNTGKQSHNHTHSVKAHNLAHTHTFSGKTDDTGIPHTHKIPYMSILASSGSLELWLQQDGHMVLYRNGSAIWNSGPEGGSAENTRRAIVIGREAASPFNTDSSTNTTHYHWFSGQTERESPLLNNVTHSVDVNTGNASQNYGNHYHSVTAKGKISDNGSDTAHNNLQPYITCYMWKRTA